MMYFCDCLSVDRVRVSGQLVDLLVDVALDLSHESTLSICIAWDLLGNIEIIDRFAFALELAVYDLLVGLGDHHAFLLEPLFFTQRVGRNKLAMGFKELSKNGFTLVN